MPKISVLTPTIRPEGLSDIQKCLQEQMFTDFEWLVEVGLPKFGNDLNRAYNKMLRRAKGELIVSIQDHTTFSATLLQSCWDAYQEHPDTFFTVDVGHTDGTTVEWDWRHERRNTDTKCSYNEWEICVGFAPKKALIEIGGFDELLDDYTWGFDNVDVGIRAEQAGYKFAVLQNEETVQFKHKPAFPSGRNLTLANARLDELRRGEKVLWYTD